MQQRDVWSLSLGRWGGAHVRLHIFFVLFGVITGYLAWQEKGGDSFMPLAMISVILLFISVLIHELGHYITAKSVGGHMDVIVLGPVGGLRPLRVPGDPQGELLATLAGPLATLGLALLSLACAIMFQPEGAGDLVNPFAFERNAGGEIDWLPLVFRLSMWINAWLFIVNLIPAFPFDGGRAAAAFLRVVRPQMTSERAISLVATFARLVAIALFVAAIFLRNQFDHAPFPSWLALLLLSVFVFFSARAEEYQFDGEEEDEELFGYDFSQGYTSLERSAEPRVAKPGFISRWWKERKRQQEVAQKELEAAEDREADDILARLHEVGMDGLSPRERSLLKRVSQRLRTREKD